MNTIPTKEFPYSLKEVLAITEHQTIRYGDLDSKAILIFYFPSTSNNWRYYKLYDYVVLGTASGPGIVLIPRTLKSLQSDFWK